MSDLMLGAEDAVVNKTGKIPALRELTISKQRMVTECDKYIMDGKLTGFCVTEYPAGPTMNIIVREDLLDA